MACKRAGGLESNHPEFLKGQRVEMTDEARRLFPPRIQAIGTVTSNQRDERYVNVRRDGRKQSERWAAIFWEPAK